ncbi:MAG: 2-oxoacid:acceptor oxidoreductase family protein [Deltaproteobacteria bacterium]|nr:2-oxoacid:acceptor oxidoreductase family protein [Deltaproteobacteria bacterium]MBW2660836.1 2-oxoacid:acceptor oxidoreductase family protein [Deltaproteobacteria bacterium]
MTDKQKQKKGIKEVIVTGFGGQGIIMAGRIIGMSAVLGDHMHSVFTQSYGPESRGGACSAQVIISDVQIHYPYVKQPDILICMSQGGYDKFVSEIKQEGILLIDRDLVRPGALKRDFFSIPATRMAEDLGRKMMANIIMVGFCVSVTNVISKHAAMDSIVRSVPKGTEEANKRAFNKGYDYGLAVLKGRGKKAAGQTGAIV